MQLDPLQYKFHPESNSITIEGVRYSAELFRNFAQPGNVFRVIKIDGDLVTVERLHDIEAE